MRSSPTALLALAMAAGPALAESHAVTVLNAGSETIRRIEIGSGSNFGANRLQSSLPPGAVARIGYSMGCEANVRLVYDSGRSEDHIGVDACTDARVIAGTAGTAGPTVTANPSSIAPKTTPVPASRNQTVRALPAKAPPPVVPPWTGKSITKRFGGMD